VELIVDGEMRWPLHVDLSGDVARTVPILGAATDAILAGRGDVLVFDLGKNAVDPRLLGPMMRWHRRNEGVIRTRVRAQVLVVPRFWHALQWRLASMLDKPPIEFAIVRSSAAAHAWIASRRAASLPSPATR
jgi:hypothetical protein